MSTLKVHNSLFYYAINNVKGVVKFISVLLIVILYLTHHLLAGLLLRFSKRRIQLLTQSTQFFSNLILKILNVHVQILGPRLNTFSGLVVANHLSYLDILIIMSVYPSTFVTSIEVKQTFLLGKICQLAQCVFIERRRELRPTGSTNKNIRTLAKILATNQSITLFPEGTTTDGKDLLAFKAPLFRSAQMTKKAIIPLAIKYSNSDLSSVCWYGEMSFFDHLYHLCCLRSLDVRVFILPSFSIPLNTELRSAASLAREKIWTAVFS